MQKILSCLLLFCLALAGCREKAADIETPVLERKAEVLVDSEMVRPIGLKTAWNNVIPLQRTERLKSLELVGSRVYAFTSRNYVVSMDKTQCNPVISFYVGQKGFTFKGWDIWGDRIYSVIGSELVEMDWRSGSKIRSFSLGFGPSCPPVRNEQFYYLAGPDKRLRIYQASDFVELFSATADDDSAIISVIAEEDFIIFGTNTGFVTAMHSDRAVKIWDFKAAQGINHGLIRDSGIVYFSSSDTHVYALNENTGRLIWKYRTDALLRNAPAVTRRFVYQNVDGQGLIALDKRTGRVAWRLSEGISLLAESSKGVYVLGKNSELIFVDAVNWEKTDSILLPKISLYISNVVDSRIYLADDLGRVVCLESIN